jgi:uncharacterized membrane protein YgcG
MTSNSAAVAYYTADMPPATSNVTVQFNLQITNAGFSTLSLSDVTIRYWFTADGNPSSNITFTTSYSANGNMGITSSVHGVFMPAPAANMSATSDMYLELSFDAAAGGLSALSGGGATIQATFHGPYYPAVPFNETNDYSFDATKTMAGGYQPSKSITAYLKGQLVWGCEPGSGGSGSSGGSSSSSSSGSGDAGGGG